MAEKNSVTNPVTNKNSKLLGKNQYQSIKEIDIVRLASDGAGVGFIDEKTTFVPGMLPGEKGRIRIVEDKKTYQRAEIMDIFNPSLVRQAPPCSIYTECGGCDLQHLPYEITLDWKRQWVEDALSRIGGLHNIQVESVIGLEEPWRYRNKAVLHRDHEGHLGYYRHKSHDVVQFSDCLLLSENTNRRIRRIREVMGKCCPGIHTITFRESNRGKGLVLFDGNVKEPKELEQKIRELKKEELFSPNQCSIGIAKGSRDFEGSGAQYLNEYIDDIRFRVSPRAFLQVNPQQTKRLYSLVLDYAGLTGKEEVWDLYCGIGTITLMLAKRAGRVIGIEENPFAVEDAKENAKDNTMKNVSFLQGKVEDKIKGLSGTPDIVVTDPPRAGMDPKVIQRLFEMKPHKIIYVSCNPATLARDLKSLGCSDEGCGGVYKIEKIQPVDMFPWGAHVESMVLMTNSGLKGK